MRYSPESLEAAAKMTGLAKVTHIRADDLDELKQKTSRLAEFVDRQKYLDRIDLSDFPLPKLKPFDPPLSS